jgi:putative endopeptidase
MNSGLEMQNIKESIRPQDDLYRHVNGGWLEGESIPADRARQDSFYQLFETAEKQVREIIEAAGSSTHEVGTIEQKIGDLYATFMDSEQAEELGLTPVKYDLDRALAISDSRNFHILLGQFEAKGAGGLFYQFITTDNKDSNTNIAYLGQSGLSLPDEAYYHEEEYAPVRDELLIHIEKMFNLAAIPNGAKHAKNILTLETQIASHHWDQVKDRDAVLTYNKLSLDQLMKLSVGLNWKLWMEHSETPTAVMANTIVRQPSFFAGIGSMLANFDAEKWSSWLAWHLLSGAAPYLNSALVNQNFAFYGTTLTGTPQLRERWKRAVSLIEAALGEAVGEIYVQRHFSPEAKTEVAKMVKNLLHAYRVEIAALPWMGVETKEAAIEKLDKFTSKVGYPDKWRDYSALEIVPGEMIGNLERISRYSQNHEFAKIGGPVDRTEWFLTPQTINAYYNPGMNEIVFPAAILQPPFYNLAGDDAVNYGAIGAIIGHEIGHGFDDQGSKYDGNGNLKDWWSDEDRTQFEKLASVLIAQYEKLHPAEAPEFHVNGALTIGENIGDLGGLTIAIKAFQLSLGAAPDQIIDGLTGIQRLFFGWAQTWRSLRRPEEVKRLLSMDPHSPNEFRCNQVVRNLSEFYDAFGVTESDEMYLPPHDRVRIW